MTSAKDLGATMEGLLAAKHNAGNIYTLDGGKHLRPSNIAGIWTDSGEWILRVDKPHPGKVDSHHININQKVSRVPDPHIKISETTANAIGKTCNTIKTVSDYVGYATTAVDVYRLSKAVCSDLSGKGPMDETKKTAASMAGGYVIGRCGAYVGSAVGSKVGGVIGMLGGPVGVVVLGAIGSMVGGVIGGVTGAQIGREAAEETYNDMQSSAVLVKHANY